MSSQAAVEEVEDEKEEQEEANKPSAGSSLLLSSAYLRHRCTVKKNKTARQIGLRGRSLKNNRAGLTAAAE